ncbi:MAG: hypothetical protein AAGA03_14060 [Planctomycetota bacterium]
MCIGYRFAALIAVAVSTMVGSQSARAQHPVYYAAPQAVVPAVVGYTARRGGLLGQRVVYRPVVGAATVSTVAAPAVAVAAPTVAVAAPAVALAAPAVTVARPAITLARPVIAPVVTRYRPVTYAVPITSYRVPVLVGF